MTRMTYKLNPFVLLIILLLLTQSNVWATTNDDWQHLIHDGSSQKFNGEYDLAIQSFTKALDLSVNQKLPPKYLPISLCRLIDVEVIINEVDEADVHFKKLVEVFKQQKESDMLDPQVNFWMAVLSDSYINNTKPATREKCLRRACYLKNLVYGSAHNESKDSLIKLACYYVDQNEIEKAIHILNIGTEVSDKLHGKDPDSLGDILNLLAVKYKSEGKYEQSKKLELLVVDKAERSNTRLHSGLPAFYSLLGINALIQNSYSASKEYFKKAILACSKIKNKRDKEFADQYINLLIMPAFKDIEGQKTGVAETELRHILVMEKILNISKCNLYRSYTYLALAIISKKCANHDEYDKCLNSAIAIARDSHSKLANDIPDLYMRLGLTDANPDGMPKSNIAFIKALESETDKHGFHATLVYFWWAWELLQHQADPLEKLNMALKQAESLRPTKRGTLLADILKLKANILRSRSKVDLALSLEQESETEIKLQKNLKSTLGPDFYHRL